MYLVAKCGSFQLPHAAWLLFRSHVRAEHARVEIQFGVLKSERVSMNAGAVSP